MKKLLLLILCAVSTQPRTERPDKDYNSVINKADRPVDVEYEYNGERIKNTISQPRDPGNFGQLITYGAGFPPNTTIKFTYPDGKTGQVSAGSRERFKITGQHDGEYNWGHGE